MCGVVQPGRGSMLSTGVCKCQGWMGVGATMYLTPLLNLLEREYAQTVYGLLGVHFIFLVFFMITFKLLCTAIPFCKFVLPGEQPDDAWNQSLHDVPKMYLSTAAAAEFLLPQSPSPSAQQQQQNSKQAAALVLDAISRISISKTSPHLRVLGQHAAPPAWHRLEASLSNHAPKAAPGRPCMRRLAHTHTRRTPTPTLPHIHPRCCLTPSQTTTRFRKHAINAFLARAFHRLPRLMGAAGLPAVALSPHDLFHAHLFQTTMHYRARRKLGLLFHCKEYPVRASELNM